jgi:hypothetical protein
LQLAAAAAPGSASASTAASTADRTGQAEVRNPVMGNTVLGQIAMCLSDSRTENGGAPEAGTFDQPLRYGYDGSFVRRPATAQTASASFA